MKFQYTKIWVLTKYLMRLHLFDFWQYGNYKEKDTLNENFKAKTDAGSGVKHTQCTKNMQNWENFIFIVFSTHLQTLIITPKKLCGHSRVCYN